MPKEKAKKTRATLACEHEGGEGANDVKPRESRLGMAVAIVMGGVVLLPLAYIALIGPVL